MVPNTLDQRCKAIISTLAVSAMSRCKAWERFWLQANTPLLVWSLMAWMSWTRWKRSKLVSVRVAPMVLQLYWISCVFAIAWARWCLLLKTAGFENPPLGWNDSATRIILQQAALMSQIESCQQTLDQSIVLYLPNASFELDQQCVYQTLLILHTWHL